MSSEPLKQATMKAVVWEGTPYQMVVKYVPKPKIESPTEVLVCVTTAAICGSDLHTYHGKFGGSDVPYLMGHEAIGIIAEVGNEVKKFRVNDRVVIPDGSFSSAPTFSYGFGNVLVPDIGGCQGMLCSKQKNSPSRT